MHASKQNLNLKKLIFLSQITHKTLNVIQSHQPESTTTNTTQPDAQHALLSDLNADNELSNIINEYERRLEEQVALAREDVLHEIEDHIQVSHHLSTITFMLAFICGTN